MNNQTLLKGRISPPFPLNSHSTLLYLSFSSDLSYYKRKNNKLFILKIFMNKFLLNFFSRSTHSGDHLTFFLDFYHEIS